MNNADLKPCPFCGGGQTKTMENGRVWSGTRYTPPISVSVLHYCDKPEGQPRRAIERVGRDMESAVAAWNMRADPPPLQQAASLALTALHEEAGAYPEPIDHVAKAVEVLVAVGVKPATWPEFSAAYQALVSPGTPRI